MHSVRRDGQQIGLLLSNDVIALTMFNMSLCGVRRGLVRTHRLRPEKCIVLNLTHDENTLCKMAL